PRRSVEKENSAFPVDQHRGRGIALQQRTSRRFSHRGGDRLDKFRRPVVRRGMWLPAIARRRIIDQDVPGRTDATIYPPFLGYGFEQIIEPPDGFGIAEKQPSARTQAKMTQGNDALLRLLLQVDQSIAARNDIQP